MWTLFNRAKSAQPAASRWDLGETLVRLSPNDPWTIGDAVQGVQIWGSTGSSKTTGSLAWLLKSYLKNGFGALLLTVKPTDREFYEYLCRDTGRSADLMRFGPGHGHTFNFLDAELARTDRGAGHIENLVGLFTTVIDLTDRDGNGGGREEESYWKKTNRQLLRNALELLVQAKGRVTVTDLHRLVVSAPTSNEQVRSDTWRAESFCFECLREADAKSTGRAQLDLRLATDFFLIEWPHLSEKTRSIILSTLTSMLDVLGRGLLRELLGSEVTTIRPEMACDGKIILVDLPLKLFGEVGLAAQIIWKHCFQRCMERRDIAANPRPIALVVDESHLLVTSGTGGGGGDQLFQTTARSSRVATIYATQSISNYLAAFGGDKGEAEVHSLLGNLQTQIFHQQADTKTNTYAAELIGRTRQYFMNSNTSWGAADPLNLLLGQRTDAGGSAGMSESYEFEVQPSEFTTLRQGGPPDWLVDAIVVRGGRRFHRTGRPWLPITIRQTLPSPTRPRAGG